MDYTYRLDERDEREAEYERLDEQEVTQVAEDVIPF